jgi:hypothetical protein
MAVNDLDDDILEELKSINNLLERVAASNARIEQMMSKAWESYSKLTK